MKKLVLFFAAVLITAISSNLFAQSTGTAPVPGATHNYHITNNGNTMAWSVTKGDLTTSTTDATIASPAAAATDITWASSVVVGDWYYVHVLETDANGCSNEKVLAVQIAANPFYLTIAAASATQCYDGAVTASIDATDHSLIHYDHGNATIVFTVTPSGLSTSYSGYEFDLAIAFGGYTNLDASNVTFSANGSMAGTLVTVSDNNPVTITYTIDNTNDFTNTNDAAGTAADYTATATISNGKAINGVGDNGAGVYNDATDVARPHTTGIQTN